MNRDPVLSADVTPGKIQRGTPEFLRTNLALFSAGFATFALLYSIQPLLPVFSQVFGVSAASSSLSLSLTTAALAVSMLVAASLSEKLGRKPVMVASLLGSGVLTLCVAASPGWTGILVLRTLMGVSLSGLPAVAMAYVSEEMHPRSVGLAMGLYIGGSGLGGMIGRLLTGIITDLLDWRAALLSIGVVGIASGLVFWHSLPPSRHFAPHRPAGTSQIQSLFQAFALHLGDAALPWLFLEGFLLMGGFVTAYNYVGYRLLAPPFGLSQTVVGLIFSVYLVGIVSSAVIGDLAGKLGRRRVMPWAVAIMLAGTALTATGSLALVVLGMASLTFGFFGAHSIASSWVGVRAQQARAQASSLYLLFYYLGSSVVGSLGGVSWDHFGWTGVVELTGSLIVVGLLVSFRLAAIPPLNEPGVGHDRPTP